MLNRTQRFSHLASAGLLLAVLSNAPASAGFDPVGIWTMKQDNAPRECRLQLRNEPLGTGRALAMPPGCHRAFPVLNGVRSWVKVDDAHVSFNNDADAALLLFESDATGQLHASGPEGGDSFTLTSIGPRPRADTIGQQPMAAAVVAVPRPVAVATITPAAVAGHYAVMRGSRDTGCMVTLDEPPKSSASPFKARLAPACRDQGIIVFDPVGWQLKAGNLVLTARKGHTADFQRDEAGHWVKDGKSPLPLGLKRL